jgi:hypothetical protein
MSNRTSSREVRREKAANKILSSTPASARILLCRCNLQNTGASGQSQPVGAPPKLET